jgi:hypothetical protein
MTLAPLFRGLAVALSGHIAARNNLTRTKGDPQGYRPGTVLTVGCARQAGPATLQQISSRARLLLGFPRLAQLADAHLGGSGR